MSPKSYAERLRYHARRFEGKRPRNVLKRYEQRLQLGPAVDELQKNAFHVAAWVAELPAEQITLEYDGLSAVLLLQQYLKILIHAQPVGNHLIKAFTRICERIHAESYTEMQWLGLLNDLQPFVPEAKTTKATKLMHKAINIWRNTTCETKQAEYVALLEKELGEAGSNDMCQIRSIFRRAVAAMSPPHCAPCSDTLGSATDVLQLTKGRQDLQFRLRKVVLSCLDHLDLADSKVHPALQILNSLLSKFLELDTSDHDLKIGCKKHWRLLAVKCGLSSTDDNNGVCLGTPKKQKRIRCQHGKESGMCRICRPCRHGKLKNNCAICRPCPHGKVRQACKECCGCEHGRLKLQCRVCNACVHGRNKYKCEICSPCPHGRVKYNCRLCNACVHGRLKYKCRECKQRKQENRRGIVVMTNNIYLPEIHSLLIIAYYSCAQE